MAASARIGFVDATNKLRWVFDDADFSIKPITDNTQTLGGATTRVLVNDYRPVLSIANWVGGTALASSTAATSLLTGATGKGVGTVGTIAAGNINRIGASLHFRFYGIIANTSTPNLTMAVKLGSDITVTTAVNATAAITGTTSWILDVCLTVLTTGATGTVRAAGKFTYQTSGLAAITWDLPDGGAITANLTVAKAIDLIGTWGTSSSSNTISHTHGSCLMVG